MSNDFPPVTLVREPVIIPLASMQLNTEGLTSLVQWLETYRPECLPRTGPVSWMDLFPHDRQGLSDNELLVELAGRECYHSYGQKAGRKTNKEYIEHSQSGSVPHRSIMYHAKMTFFVAGISRRVSHELIRHYVGSDRDEEGSPSQESTRYTFHPGHFVVPPRILGEGEESVKSFETRMSAAYGAYLKYIEKSVGQFERLHGSPPKGMDRKRIFEAAAGELPMQATTSFVWTSNPVALSKMFLERRDASADLEFNRLATKWQALCLAISPNLFPYQE